MGVDVISGAQWALDAFHNLKSQGDWWRDKPREERDLIEQQMSADQRRYSENTRIKRRLEKVA